MKPLLLTILICFTSLTAFAQEIHYSGERTITIPLGKAESNATMQVNPLYQTKEDVLMDLGEPVWKEESEQREVWHYPEQSMFIFFKRDKVIEIDAVAEENRLDR